MAALFAHGYVKSVLSGDSLVLLGGANAGEEPQEKVIVLSGIQCPKFCRSKNQGKDEPYAWEARELVRKLCIGKQVAFQTVAGSGSAREYCHVYAEGKNLTHMLIKAGLATVKEGKEGQSIRDDKRELMDMEAVAKKEGKGLHSADAPEAHVRDIDWDPSAEALFAKYRGLAIPAVINQVRDGSCFRCEVQGAVGKAGKGRPFMMVNFNLAGALSPRVPLSHEYRVAQHEKRLEANPDYEGQAPEKEDATPFATEAVTFSEMRLLNREVRIVPMGMDMSNNLFGVIQYPKGDITSRLLETGLASFVPWSAAMLTEGKDVLEAAATKARDLKLRLGTKEVAEPPRAEFEGKVVFVSSGDTLLIHDGTTEIRVGLASVRAPRLGNARRGEKDAPYAMEAREYLRSRLIGKKVRVLPEYSRKQGTTDRLFATIIHGPVNLAVALTADGLAEPVAHRQDEARAQHYHKLVEASIEAKRSFKGMHSSAKAAAPIIDLTERRARPKDGEVDTRDSGPGGSKSRQYLGVLQRDKVCNAVVEYVFSATRMKCYVPKENIMITVALVGVKCPRGEEAFGQEATDFVRGLILQHNVRLEVETVDKGDNFIGTLWFGPTNLGTSLLEAGLGSVMTFSANRSPHGVELIAAEVKAKEAKLKMWENYVEAEVVLDEEGNEAIVKAAAMSVVVTEVADAVTFYFNDLGDPNKAKLEALMATFNAEVPAEAPEYLEKSTVYAGLYNDGEWYRVRTEGMTATGHMRVFFLDFGNHDVLEPASFRELPAAAQTLPGLSKPALLAGLRAPTKTSDHFESAAITFNDAAFDRTMSAKVECVDKAGKMHVTLTDPEEPTHSVNQQLLRGGWVRLLERPEYKLKPYVEALRDDEEYAKNTRLNVWEYGDVSDEDEEDAAPGKTRFDGRTGKPKAY
jgi:staphylococcal nuclease domain-containing protein 1